MLNSKLVVSNCSLAIWAIPLLSLTGALLHADEKGDKQAGTTKVKVGDLVLTVPAQWKNEKPKSRLRLAQFRIPAVAKDKSDAELAIYSFGASDVSANIRRWISQYEAEGRMVKISQGAVPAGGKYVFVELSGIYNKPVGPPIAGKTEPTPGSRTFAVMLLSQNNVYYLKMNGPDKTVADQAKPFRDAFGADGAKETEIKLDEQADKDDNE